MSYQTESNDALDRDIDALLGEGGRMFLSTASGNVASGSTVFYGRDEDSLVFFTFNPTRKAEQIRANPRVQAVIWPADQAGIRGLQIDGLCRRIRDKADIDHARDAVLGVTTAFRQYMDDPFLSDNGVTGYYRLRPTSIKLVDFHADPQFRFRDYPHQSISDFAAMAGDVGRRALLWIRALRAPFFTATLAPVLLGAAVAANELPVGSSFPWGIFWWALFGALAAHAGTNLANDYGDHLTGNDRSNRTPSPFNGGSRVIQAGLLPPWKILTAALAAFALCIYCGLTINREISGAYFALSPLLVIGLIGVLLGIFYSLGPQQLSYHGLGEPAIAIGFGPVMVMGSHYVLTAGQGGWSWLAPLLSSIPLGLLVMLIVWINQFQDVPADQKTGKWNQVVRLAGRDGSYDYRPPFRVYRVVMVLTFGLLALLAAFSWWPGNPGLSTPWLLLALLPALALPWIFARGRAWLDAARETDVDWQRHPYHLLPVNVSTIAVHLATGLLMALAWTLEATVGS